MKVFKKLVKNNSEMLEKYMENPLSKEEILDMVHDANLSDRQLLKILSIIQRKWGQKSIAPHIRDRLKERKVARSTWSGHFLAKGPGF